MSNLKILMQNYVNTKIRSHLANESPPAIYHTRTAAQFLARVKRGPTVFCID